MCGSSRDGAVAPIAPIILGVLPLLLLLVADQISALFQKSLVSGLATGSISALNYAAKLEGLPVGIFAAVSTVFFPALVQAMNHGNRAATRQCFLNGFSVILYLAAPAMAFLCLQSTQTVTVLFERGKFDADATVRTADALVLYSLGIVPQAFIVYLGRCYYAARDTWTPMVIGLSTMVVHVFVCWFAVDTIGYLGIAVGTTIYAVIYALTLWWGLRKVIAVSVPDVLRVIWRPAVAAAGMVAMYSAVEFPAVPLGLALSLISGGALYTFLLTMLRDPVMYDGLRRVTQKLRSPPPVAIPVVSEPTK